MIPSDPRELTGAFIRSVPLAAALGFEEAGLADGTIAIRQPRHPQSLEENGSISYGAAAALVDQIFAAAILAEAPDKLITTLTLHMDWFGTWSRDDELVAFVEKPVCSQGTAWAQASVRTVYGKQIGKASANFMLDAAPGGGAGQRDWSEVVIEGERPQSFAAFLGLDLKGQDVALTPVPHLVGVRAVPAVHGGMLAALLEAAAARLALSWSTERKLLSQSVRYLRPAVATSPLRARAEVVRQGKRMIALNSSAWQERAGEAVLVTCSELVYVASGVAT